MNQTVSEIGETVTLTDIIPNLIINQAVTAYFLIWLAVLIYQVRKKWGPIHILDMSTYCDWTLGKDYINIFHNLI